MASQPGSTLSEEQQRTLAAIAKEAESMAKTQWPNHVEYFVVRITVYHVPSPSAPKAHTAIGWSASIRGSNALVDGKPNQQLGHVHKATHPSLELTISDLRKAAATIYSRNPSLEAPLTWIETGERPPA